MTMGICLLIKYIMLGQFPHGQRFLAGQIPMVSGSQMDFTLNDHGEMSVFNFRGTVSYCRELKPVLFSYRRNTVSQISACDMTWEFDYPMPYAKSTANCHLKGR